MFFSKGKLRIRFFPTDRLMRIVSFIFLWFIFAVSAHSKQWPNVLPVSKEFDVDFSSGWVEIDLPIVGQDGKTKYLFWCRGGTTEKMDAYEEKTGFAFAGSFLCRLNEGDAPEDLSLLQEDGSAVWYSRGQFSAGSLKAGCENYPEFGAVRNFHLRNLRLTLTLRKINFNPDSSLSRFRMRVEVQRDKNAFGENAERPRYLPPRFGDCSKVKKGIEPRMCRGENFSWTECSKIGE